MSALHYRNRTGHGQRIDTALLDSLVVALDNLGERYTIGGEILTRAGNIAVTGISAVVRPDGALAGRLGVGEEGTIVTGLLGRDDRSPYTRAPWLVPALGALLAAAAWIRARRAAGAPPPPIR